jgi:RimJ/RimL family protein N-acetyltransferase
MPEPHRSKIPKKKIRIDCGRYWVRTLTTDDASERWASWMDEKSRRLVNAAPQAMTQSDVAAYIKQFDQRTHLLLGIFEKLGGAHVGFFRVDIDPVLHRCLIYVMLEREYRHLPRTRDIVIPFHDFIFETLGLKTALATALASNRAMMGFLLRTGWTLERTAEGHVKSQTADGMLDLCFLSLTREAWRAWKAAHVQDASAHKSDLRQLPNSPKR